MSGHQPNHSSRCRNSRGFTLLELVIVVCLISILSQISLSYFTDFQARAKDATAILDGRNLLTAVETNFAHREVVDYEHDPGDGSQIGSPSIYTLAQGVRARITAGSQSLTTEGTGYFEAYLYHVNGTDDPVSHSGKREYYYLIDESLNLYSLP